MQLSAVTEPTRQHPLVNFQLLFPQVLPQHRCPLLEMTVDFHLLPLSTIAWSSLPCLPPLVLLPPPRFPLSPVPSRPFYGHSAQHPRCPLRSVLPAHTSTNSEYLVVIMVKLNCVRQNMLQRCSPGGAFNQKQFGGFWSTGG